MFHRPLFRPISMLVRSGVAFMAISLFAGCGELETVDPPVATPAADSALPTPAEVQIEPVVEDEAPEASAEVAVVAPVPIPIVEDTEPVTLKLAFWNIQWFPGTNPKPTAEQEAAQIAMVQQEIAEIAPDVLGMSEIRDARSANLAVAKLHDVTVDVVSRFAGRDEEVGQQQLVIASKIPAMSAWNEEWKSANPPPPRGFAFAAYQINERHVLLFYSLHLKSNWGERPANYAMREESARQLLAHTDAMRETYAPLGEVTVVLAGDFNTSLDDEAFQNEKTLQMILDAGYRWAWDGVPLRERHTLPAGGMFPSTCFDHMFVLGPAAIISAVMPRTSHISSDHRPIVTTLEFP